MQNGYKIKWSEDSVEDLQNIIQYLSENWTEREIKRFVRDLERNISSIRIFPFAFQASYANPEIRRCVISKLNSIYYSIDEKVITILSIHCNRRLIK